MCTLDHATENSCNNFISNSIDDHGFNNSSTIAVRYIEYHRVRNQARTRLLNSLHDILLTWLLLSSINRD